MRLPDPLRHRLIRWACARHVQDRPPDFIIGSEKEPYLLRWFVFREGRRWRALSEDERQRLFQKNNPRHDIGEGRNVYIHRFLRSDDDRALHDHPWPWRTIVLEGEYLEHRPADPNDPSGPTVTHHHRAGDIGTRRSGTEAHRVELIDGKPALTLFVTGRREREWGFWCPVTGWRHWREFTAPGDSGQVGRGCE